MNVWIEFLRQKRSGVTDRTWDRTDSKRQDGLQETGQTARDRTDSKGQDRDWKEDWVRCRAGQHCNSRWGGLLSKIETGNVNRSDGTGQEGQNRKERIHESQEKIKSKLRNRDSNTAQNDKIWKRQERTERNVKKDRGDRTEYQFHKSLEQITVHTEYLRQGSKDRKGKSRTGQTSITRRTGNTGQG
jgi:hypothetical protein